MYTDDDRRHLFDLLERSLGARGATILMGHLPPTGWGELATRADVLASASELRGEMAELRGEIARLDGRISAMLPKLVAANLASMVGLSGLILGVFSIAG